MTANLNAAILDSSTAEFYSDLPSLQVGAINSAGVGELTEVNLVLPLTKPNFKLIEITADNYLNIVWEHDEERFLKYLIILNVEN